MKINHEKEILVLRTVGPDRRSYGGFLWPESGPVECPDWDPDPTRSCGGGLHGLPRGEGYYGLIHDPFGGSTLWQIIRVKNKDAHPMNCGKIRFRKGIVEYTGDRYGCMRIMRFVYPDVAVHYMIAAGGNGSTLTGGDHSTLSGDDRSVLTGGDYSVLTGGNRSTLAGGNYSTLTGGNRSTLAGGDYSVLTGGDYSVLTGGDQSTLSIWHWDGTRMRLKTAYVGENGIKPNVAYTLNCKGEFVKLRKGE